MDIIKKIKSLHKRFEGLNLLQTYVTMMRDDNFRLLLKRMKPMDIVKIVYGVYTFNQKKDVQEVLDKIESGLFAFSIVSIEDDPAEINCTDCQGLGYETCDMCDGNGGNSCLECNGDGTIWDEDEDTSKPCDECDGRGEISCEYCGGGGSNNCDECNGDGYIYSDNHSNLSILVYLCYDESILFKLQKAFETNSPLSHDLEISFDKNCIRLAFNEISAKDNLKLTFKIDEKYKDETFVNDIKEILDYDLIINDKSDKGSILSVRGIDKFYREKFQE